MPRISAFHGVTIWMYWDDHRPPHFHAHAGEHEVLLSIDRLRVLRGWLPPRTLRMVREWALLHRPELLDDWERAQRREPLVPIDPLP